MIKIIRTTLAATLAASGIAAAPEPAAAQGYAIDCAILLCLGGGWPASVPCERARIEFIRRITPWPIEPPLQIWRCPMGVSFRVDPAEVGPARLYDIVSRARGGGAPLQSLPLEPVAAPEPQPALMRRGGDNAERLPEGFSLSFVQAQEYSSDNGKADIDISGAAFDFVRSIRLFHIVGLQMKSVNAEARCLRRAAVRLGSYGTQGEFAWEDAPVDMIPEAHVGMEGYGAEDCPAVQNQSVFIEWQDATGSYGSEQVDY